MAVGTSYYVAAAATGLAIIWGIFLHLTVPTFDYKEKHVIITGGSMGIGFDLAKLYLQRGAHVTIVARNKSRLEAAAAELETLKLNKDQIISIIAVDIASSMKEVQEAFEPVIKAIGSVHVLINNAGTSLNEEFLRTSEADFKHMLNLNVLGSVYPTKVVAESMKNQLIGRIVFVSSQLAQSPLYGYSAYAASKLALRGLAEALQMELLPYRILISVAYPPDTRTPGYEEEMKTKSDIAKKLCEVSSVFDSKDVAADIIAGSTAGYFTISTGFDGWLLKHLHIGMSPINNLIEVAQQIIFSPLRLVSAAYMKYFNYLCDTYTRH